MMEPWKLVRRCRRKLISLPVSRQIFGASDFEDLGQRPQVTLPQ